MSNQKNMEDLRLREAAGSSLEVSAYSGQVLESNNVNFSQYFTFFLLISGYLQRGSVTEF